MGTAAGNNSSSNKKDPEKPDANTFGANNLANRAAQPVGGNQQQSNTNAAGPQVAGVTTQTPNGSKIGQSPKNPSMNLSAGQSNTPSQTLNYATRPGIGMTNFDAINKPDPTTFGANNLANRAARPVGRSMSDPQRRAEMARRAGVANNDVQGAAQVAGVTTQTPNGSAIGQSPMNPSMNLSDGLSNTPTLTLNYATRPGTGMTDFDAINKPDPKTFGANNLANRAARPVGRSMSDPQRRADMARRAAVANSYAQGAEKPDETRLEGRAKGGPVQAGKPYLVGEEGPEIIVPEQSATVVPNHKITAAAVKAARRAQSQQRPRVLTPRQTPAEAYALLRVNKESTVHRQAAAAASEKKDSTKRHANAPKSRFFEARPTPANAAEYLRGRHLPGRADGGPVQAGKSYMVGERGPEIIVPKKSGAVIPGKDSAAKDWFDEWQERDVDRAEKARPAGHLQIEREQGLSSVRHMLKGKPSGLMEEFGAGLAEGATRVGQLAASVGSYLPGQVGRDYEARRKVYAERAEIMKKYRERDEVTQKSFYFGAPGKWAAAGVSAIPEIYNPVNKAGWGAKAINAGWHGVRGYLPNKSVHDGVVGALSSVAGENAEDLMRKGKMVAGNVAGMVTEKVLNKVLPDDKAKPPPPSIPGPIPKPVQGADPNAMPVPGIVVKPMQAASLAPEKKKEEKKLSGYEMELMKKKIPPSLRPMKKF